VSDQDQENIRKYIHSRLSKNNNISVKREGIEEKDGQLETILGQLFKKEENIEFFTGMFANYPQNNEKDPFYDGLSQKAIEERYKKADGSNLLYKSFMGMKLEVQRETVRGYDKAISMYGGNPPQKLKAGRMSGNVFAKYSLDFKTITFNETAISEQGQAYATAIHEITHHAQNIKLFSSESVLKSAFKKLGIGARSKVAVTLKMKTVGSMQESDYNHADELVAYAIERQMTGRTNPLTDAIYSVLKEKGAIK
jgi:hypothetical protein